MPKNREGKELTFRERATKGFAWNYFYKLAEFGLMNLYTILVVRHFGPAISAPYAVFTALCTSISMVAAFAVDGVLLRYIHRISTNEDVPEAEFSNIEHFGLRNFLKTLFAFRILVVSIVSFAIISAVYFLPFFSESSGSIKEFTPYLVIFLFAQSIIAFCTYSLVGLLETKGVFIASLIARSFLVSIGLLLLSQDILSLQYALLFYVISAGLQSIILLITLKNHLHLHEPRRGLGNRFPFLSVLRKAWEMISHPKEIKYFLATPLMLYGITTWGSDILSTVLGRQPDILMMRAMLGAYTPQIGYYLSASIVLLVTEYVFLFGLGGTLVSIFSKLAHDDEKEYHGEKYPQLSKARKEIAGFQNVVLLPLCAYMMLFAPDVMRMIYGVKYDDAIPMVRIGLVALTLSVGIFGGGMQVTSLVAIGKERLVFRNRLFWGITNVTANVFLIRFYGGIGAIIGTQFSNAFSCGSEGYFAGKLIGNAFDLLATLKLILISSGASVASFFLTGMIVYEGNSMLRSLLGLSFACIITFLLYFLLKVPEAHKVWRRLRTLLQGTNPGELAHE